MAVQTDRGVLTVAKYPSLGACLAINLAAAALTQDLTLRIVNGGLATIWLVLIVRFWFVDEERSP